jgi:hypothetical protein
MMFTNTPPIGPLPLWENPDGYLSHFPKCEKNAESTVRTPAESGLNWLHPVLTSL